MSQFNRRDFLKLLAVVPGASILGMPRAHGAAKARVVVIGGGFGGATAAKYVKLMDSNIEVTLIEANKTYTSCPLSNEVISGHGSLEHLQTGYDGLAKRGVTVVFDHANSVDPAKKVVITEGGKKFGYDALVMSPGIHFKYDGIKGYSKDVAELIPHAWKAGPQTLLLKKQLEGMQDGGVFVITVPKGPFRCPPGPYERAAQVASYCKGHGLTKSKILILDANDTFAKKGLFEQAWKALYPGMIEWVAASADGTVNRIDPATRTAYTELGDHKADVLNVIPPHTAGKIAIDTGLTNDKGWCEVKPMTMESALATDIYPIGDSCTIGDMPTYPMPKSAHSAATQAKVAAAAIVAKINGLTPPEPWYANTCYSLAAPDYGFSVAHVYRPVDGKLVYVKEAGGVSPVEAPALQRKLEAEYAKGWLRNIMTDAFA